MVRSHREKFDARESVDTINAGQPSDGGKRGSGRDSRRGTVSPLNVATPSRNSGEPGGARVSSALEDLMRRKGVDEAWTALEDMQRQGISTDKFTVSRMLMKTVGDGRNRLNPARVYRGIALVEKFIDLQPKDVDEVLFNALLDTCCRLKDLSRLEATVQRMKELKVSPSPVTLGILVKTHGQAGDLQKVLQVWNEMELQREQANAVTYGCMIDACVKCGHLEKAVEIFKGMRSSGKHRNTILYTTLIKGYGLEKDLPNALQLFREMPGEGVPYNSITYNSILDACVKCNDLSTGEQLLREMTSPGSHVEPDLITFSTLLKGYCHVDLDKALQVAEAIKSRGLRCDELVYNTLMDGCVKANDITAGVGLFEEMVHQGLKPSAITHSILARLYQRAGYDDDSADAVAQLYQLLGIDRPSGGERSKGLSRRNSSSGQGGTTNQSQSGYASLSEGRLHRDSSVPSTPMASPQSTAGSSYFGVEGIQMLQVPSPQVSELATSPYRSPGSVSSAFGANPSPNGMGQVWSSSPSLPPALPPWPFPSRDGAVPQHPQAPRVPGNGPVHEDLSARTSPCWHGAGQDLRQGSSASSMQPDVSIFTSFNMQSFFENWTPDERVPCVQKVTGFRATEPFCH